MSDGDPINRRGTNPRSLSNLRPPIRKGEVRNPAGKNGRHRAEIVAAFLDTEDDTSAGKKMIQAVGCPPGTPRIRALLQREFIAGMGKSDIARKTLIEQYAGRPKQQVDLSSEDGSMSPTRASTLLAELREAVKKSQSEESEPGAADAADHPEG